MARFKNGWKPVGIEGRQGKDRSLPRQPRFTKYRAEIMKAYHWSKALQELEAPDNPVAFRSWS